VSRLHIVNKAQGGTESIKLLIVHAHPAKGRLVKGLMIIGLYKQTEFTFFGSKISENGIDFRSIMVIIMSIVIFISSFNIHHIIKEKHSVSQWIAEFKHEDGKI
jgi:hypothetical protein